MKSGYHSWMWRSEGLGEIDDKGVQKGDPHGSVYSLNSSHHPQTKTGNLSCLLDLAKQICDRTSLMDELQHLEDVEPNCNICVNVLEGCVVLVFVGANV